jgi:4-hydroxy-2-oxoheptanedioate aldolase
MVCESHQVSAGIRVPGVIESDILKALDIGAHCLHVPNINNKEEAEKAIAFAKYPPIGKRGFSPFTRAGNYSIDNSKSLTARANDSVLTTVHIERAEAIGNIESILAIKELDIIFIGLFDISKSLGIPGQVEDARVIKALKEITAKTIKAGKYPGTIVNSPEQMQAFVDLGIRYITYSVECNILKQSFKQINEIFRKVK